MAYTVVVAFGGTQEYTFDLHDAEVLAISREQARAWLAQEFEALECTPSNPMGKVLALDMILNVAKYGGEPRFREAGEWARQFARATASTLGRPAIRVDVAAFVVG